MSWIVPDTAGARSLISSCGLYRYWYRLDELSDSPGTCCFIMLNPATKAGDSPAKRQGARKKCQRFAREHDFGTLLICNLFAYRSRNPKELRDVCDPIGPDNDRHIAEVVRRSDKIVCAWGNGARWRMTADRARQVVPILAANNADGKLFALGADFTKHGQPRHPGRIKMMVFPLALVGGDTLVCRGEATA